MNFKLSQTTKDFFDVIRAVSSYFTIATVGLGIILFTVDKKIIADFFNNQKLLAYILGGVLILVPFIAPIIYNQIKLYSLKKRRLSNTIIERQDVVIDIYDDGKTASYYEKLCFYKIGKKHNHHLCKLTVSGTIDSANIHVLNCFYNLNHEKKELVVSYVNNPTQLNDYPALVNVNKKFLIYSALLKDTFIAEEETWDLIPINYCIFYILTINMPLGKEIVSAQLFSKNKEEFIELSDLRPIIVTENNRQKLILEILNYDYGELLRVKWKLK